MKRIKKVLSYFLLFCFIFTFIFTPPKKQAMVGTVVLASLTAAVGAYSIAYLMHQIYQANVTDEGVKNNIYLEAKEIWRNAPDYIIQAMVVAVTKQIIEEELTSADIADFEIPTEVSKWVADNYIINSQAYYNTLNDSTLLSEAWPNIRMNYEEAYIYSSEGIAMLNIYLGNMAVIETQPTLVYYSPTIGSYVVDKSAMLQLVYEEYEGQVQTGIYFLDTVGLPEMYYASTSYSWFNNFYYSNSDEYANNIEDVTTFAVDALVSTEYDNVNVYDISFTTYENAVKIATAKNAIIMDTPLIQMRDSAQRSAAIPMSHVLTGTIDGVPVRWVSAEEALKLGVITDIQEAPYGIIMDSTGAYVGDGTSVTWDDTTTTTIDRSDDREVVIPPGEFPAGWWGEIPSLDDFKNMILGWLGGVLSLLVAPLQWIGDSLAQLAENVRNGFLNVSNAMSNLWEDAGAVWTGLADTIVVGYEQAMAASTAVMTDLWQDAGLVWTGLGNMIVDGVDGAVGALSTATSTMWQGIDAGIGNLTDTWSNTWTKITSLPAEIATDVTEGTKMMFIPRVGYFDMQVATIQTALSSKVVNFDQFRSWLNTYTGDEMEWQGLYANFEHYGIGELKVVDNYSPNQYARQMKRWIGAMLYFMTALFIIRKANELIK